MEYYCLLNVSLVNILSLACSLAVDKHREAIEEYQLASSQPTSHANKNGPEKKIKQYFLLSDALTSLITMS